MSIEDIALKQQWGSIRWQSSVIAQFFAPERRAWRGDERLWSVFWLRGVVFSLVLIVAFGLSVLRGDVLFQQILLVAFGAYTAWVLVLIWRCSDAADPFWGVLARVLTAFWAANAGLVVVAVQLELLVRYAGR